MLRTVAPVLNSKKLALRFFQMEQHKNSNLQGLSAAQKKTVVLKMFRQLSASDMEALKKRAAVWETENMGGGTATTPSQRYRNEITAYELFYKEQLTNPSIATIASPSVREKRLFAIFNSLPDVTKEALEQRAKRLSRGEAEAPLSVSSKKRPLLKKKKDKKKITTSSSKSGKTKKESHATRKKLTTTATTTRTTISPYAAFVKEQMPNVKHLPPKERMKTIAEKWNSMKAVITVGNSEPTSTAAADPLESSIK